MGWGIFLLLAVLALVGSVLVLVGGILRLCEWSWDKPVDSLGSLRLLANGFVLTVPLMFLIVYCLWPH
jgi:hypothetical protein